MFCSLPPFRITGSCHHLPLCTGDCLQVSMPGSQHLKASRRWHGARWSPVPVLTNTVSCVTGNWGWWLLTIDNFPRLRHRMWVSSVPRWPHRAPSWRWTGESRQMFMCGVWTRVLQSRVFVFKLIYVTCLGAYNIDAIRPIDQSNGIQFDSFQFNETLKRGTCLMRAGEQRENKPDC